MDPQSLNSYSYARNNPILLVDENGEFWHVVIGAGIGAVVAGGIAYYQTGSWDQTWKAAAGGAVAGAIIAAAGPAVAGTLSGAMLLGGGSAVVGNTITRALNGEEINAGTLATDAVVGAAGGALGYGAGKVMTAISSKVSSMLTTKAVPKNGVFPSNPDEFMPELPRDAKGRIYPNENTRIRIETHGLGKNGEFIPRHSELHYHVEVRPSSSVGWGNGAVTKTWNGIKSFLPGDEFPGTTVNIRN